MAVLPSMRAFAAKMPCVIEHHSDRCRTGDLFLCLYYRREPDFPHRIADQARNRRHCRCFRWRGLGRRSSCVDCRGARVIAIASASARRNCSPNSARIVVIDRNVRGSRSRLYVEAAGGARSTLPSTSSAVRHVHAVDQRSAPGWTLFDVPVRSPGRLVEFDLRQLVYKDLQLTGATIVPPGTMARLVNLIEQGLLKPLLAQAFPLAELGRRRKSSCKRNTSATSSWKHENHARPGLSQIAELCARQLRLGPRQCHHQRQLEHCGGGNGCRD